MALTRCGRKAAALRLLYVAGLMVGTYSHVSTLVRHGWRWTYGGMPLGVVVFWSALAFLDPLLAAVLFVRPRTGIVLLASLLLVDLVLNTWVILTFGGVVWMVVDQGVFFVFVVATLPVFWRSMEGDATPTLPQAEFQAR